MRYIQNKGIVVRRIDESVFLVDPQSDTLYQLDGAGSVLWLALAEPTDAAAAVRLLLTAYPEADRDTVVRDIDALLQDLSDHRLIMAIGRSPCPSVQ